MSIQILTHSFPSNWSKSKQMDEKKIAKNLGYVWRFITSNWECQLGFCLDIEQFDKKCHCFDSVRISVKESKFSDK